MNELTKSEKVVGILIFLCISACYLAGISCEEPYHGALIHYILYYMSRLYIPLALILSTMVSCMIIPNGIGRDKGIVYTVYINSVITMLFFFAAITYNAYIKNWFWLFMGSCIASALSLYDGLRRK